MRRKPHKLQLHGPAATPVPELPMHGCKCLILPPSRADAADAVLYYMQLELFAFIHAYFIGYIEHFLDKVEHYLDTPKKLY